MKNLETFDWGWMEKPSESYHIMPNGTHKEMGEYHKESMIQEIFIDKCYERFFEVQENDIVLDVGASVGPFTYSILHKKPKHVFCFEPSESEFKTLVKNILSHPVTPINKGISNVNSIVMNDHLFGGEEQMESITFQKFIDLYGINGYAIAVRGIPYDTIDRWRVFPNPRIIDTNKLPAPELEEEKKVDNNKKDDLPIEKKGKLKQLSEKVKLMSWK